MEGIRYLLLVAFALTIQVSYSQNIESRMYSAKRVDFDNGSFGNIDANFSPCRLSTNLEFYADEKNFYVKIVADIDSTFNVGKEGKRDQNSNGDHIILRLITFKGQNFAYSYVFTPLNNMIDYTTGLNINNNYEWNSDYEYESIITNDKWIVYAEIPWIGMRMIKQNPFELGIILNRWMRNEDRGFNYPHVAKSMGELYYSGAYPLTITTPIAKDNDFKIRMYYTAKYDLLNNQNYRAKDFVGMDFSVRPQFNGSIKATIQPDYSDVPLESEEDIYNSLSKPWLQENRLFFKEDLDLLSGLNSYWYSRNVISPITAIKYSLIQPNTSFVLLCAKDQKKHVYNGSDDLFNAFAIKQRVGNLGLSLNAYNRMHKSTIYNNEVASAMLSYHFWRNHSLNIEYGGSVVRDSMSLGYVYGSTGTIRYNFSNSMHTLCLTGRFISDRFRADMGNISFINRNTFDAVYTNYVYFGNSIISDFSNTLKGQYVTQYKTNDKIESYITFRNQSRIKSSLAYFGIEATYGDETYDNRNYVYKKVYFSLGSNYKTAFSPLFRLGRGRMLVYQVEKPLDFLNVYTSLESMINSNASLKLEATYYNYNIANTDTWDNQFLFANLDFAFYFNNGFSLNMGFRYNNYEIPSAYYNGYFGHYFNADWNINNWLKFTLGFQSKANHYSYSVDGEPTLYNLYDVTSQNMYLKTIIVF